MLFVLDLPGNLFQKLTDDKNEYTSAKENPCRHKIRYAQNTDRQISEEKKYQQDDSDG